MEFAIIVTFRSIDPSAFGPFPTRDDAVARLELVQERCGDNEITSVTIVPLRHMN